MENYILESLEPKPLFHFFEEISRIPRGSGNEAEISDYLVHFAKARNLEYIQDAYHNVLIKKPAYPGYEADKTILLQAHMDMVCEKNSDVEHDFTKDPIHFEVEGDRIVAEKTTLGADNGVGMALILAVLDDASMPHAAIEALFTTDEEVGMTGAEKFDATELKSRVMLNFDGGTDGTFIAGSAGGPTIDVSFPIRTVPAKRDAVPFRLSITGLKGGHSGQRAIQEGRGNANKLLSRLLYVIDRSCPVGLASISGGLKGNAIPREATTVFTVPGEKSALLEDIVAKMTAVYKNEYRVGDAGICVSLEEAADAPDAVFTEDCKQSVVRFGYLCDTGILRMCLDLEDTIESSNSLGVISMTEDAVIFRFVTRSLLESMYTDMVYRLECLAAALGGSCKNVGDCLEWEYKPDSQIKRICTDVYLRMYQKKPKIEVVHVGLECGTIGKNVPHPVDMIAMGPDAGNYHSPGEWFSISSARRFWEFLKNVLAVHNPEA